AERRDALDPMWLEQDAAAPDAAAPDAAPPRAAAPAPGALDPAVLEQAYREQLAGYKRSLVDGKGDAEHADPRNLYSMEHILQLAVLAKLQTDGVFGRYATAPPLDHRNIFDGWVVADQQHKAMESPAREARAA